MVIPNGMVYIGNWKDNLSWKWRIKKYGNKQPYRNKSNQAKIIPSLKYFKGNFEDGKSQGKMEGYVFDSDSDAAGVITDIMNISGTYSQGKLVKSNVVKKVEVKIDRPVFKAKGDPFKAQNEAEK